MLNNYKMLIEYDGTDFFGWQRQNDKTTIQGEIEKTLTKILNQKIKIHGSGRTDAGVHALGQVAHFQATTKISPSQLKKGMNSLNKKQPIVIKDCSIMDSSFHARYSVVSKEYRYFILNQDDPSAIYRLYKWHIRSALDIDAMNRCCETITGVFDFKSFENSGSPRSSTIREVFDSVFEKMPDNTLVFKICANGFLKYMVRNLVGTIVLVGLNKISYEDFIIIFKATDRTKAGPTAPAHGLFLKEVNYS
jgi:tRNA pseudouridine38-40 synthase